MMGGEEGFSRLLGLHEKAAEKEFARRRAAAEAQPLSHKEAARLAMADTVYQQTMNESYGDAADVTADRPMPSTPLDDLAADLGEPTTISEITRQAAKLNRRRRQGK